MKTNYFLCGPIRKLVFFKDFSYYTFSDESDFFQVKLYRIKTSFSTTRMQIVRHMTDEGAEEGA